MKPEAALVMALARGDRDTASAWSARDLDWERAAELAAQHQVSALCWWMWSRVSASGSDLSSRPAGAEDFSRRLRMAYLHHSLRNESLANDLVAIHDALRARHVEALYFKGPWLAWCAYPSPGTRPVDDIDLGVTEGDYAGAVKALAEIGYVPAEPPPATAVGALRQAHYRRQIRFQAHGRRPVELHFRLVNMGPPAAEEHWVWREARTLSVQTRTLLVPGPSAMLLHLLLHANQHGFGVLRLLHDIRWALARDGDRLDPGEFAARVHEVRCTASAYHGLLLARDLAGATGPARLLRLLRPSGWRRTAFSLAWGLPAARRLEVPKRRMEVEAPWLCLLEMGRLRDRVRFARGILVEAGVLKPGLGSIFPGLRTPAAGARGGPG